MSPAPAIFTPQGARAARAICASWRSLTAGTDRRTLLACSGGADSSGLVLALARLREAPDRFVVAHLRHDLRPAADTLRDLEAAQALAARAGLPFETSSVSVASGNAEAEARRVRYAALAEIAEGRGCSFIATGHHADDQVETVLMRLATGAGTSGLAGIRDSRKLATGGAPVQLIRPCLAIDRASLHAICNAAGVTWAEDATNRDTTRVRARLRSGPVQSLGDALPGLEAGVARSAAALADDAQALRELALSLAIDRPKAPGRGPVVFEREVLRACSDSVIGACLRSGASEAAGAPVRELTRQETDKLVRLLRTGQHTSERVVGPVTIGISDRSVTIALRREPRAAQSANDPA